MNRKNEERVVFPFTSIIGQEEMCDLYIKLLYYKLLIKNQSKKRYKKNLFKTFLNF
jgi:hypothetical protein